MPAVTISHPPFAQLPKKEVARLYEIMREAYAKTERDLWGENYVRISRGDFESILQQGKLLVARIDTKVVGSLYFYPIDELRYGFGILSADPAYHGKGIGRALISAAEEQAVSSGAAFMQLEILRPEHFEIPSKTVLKKWYERQGYRVISTIRFEELKPDKKEKAEQLLVPAYFDCYEKSLLS